MLALRHLPGLFVASTETFGGAAAFVDARWCLAAYGLPERFVRSPEAQTMMIVNSSKITVLGLLLFAFHYQQQYAAVDQVLFAMGGCLIHETGVEKQQRSTSTRESDKHKGKEARGH